MRQVFETAADLHRSLSRRAPELALRSLINPSFSRRVPDRPDSLGLDAISFTGTPAGQNTAVGSSDWVASWSHVGDASESHRGRCLTCCGI
jgi:hypothetical protein